MIFQSGSEKSYQNNDRHSSANRLILLISVTSLSNSSIPLNSIRITLKIFVIEPCQTYLCFQIEFCEIEYYER
jgi:hypothetical protein